jgi:hypothetical protein
MITNEGKDSGYLILVLYVLSLVATHGGMLPISRIGLSCLCLTLLVRPQFIYSSQVWFSVSILLITHIIFRFEVVANHTFLTTYVTLALGLSLLTKSEKFPHTCRILLSILLILAAIQKLISPYYMSGNLISDYIMRGNSLNWILDQFDSNFYLNQAQSDSNFLALQAAPYADVSFPAFVPHYLESLSKTLSYAGIIFEGTLGLLCVNAKALRLRIGFSFAVALVIGIYVLRDETSFLSLLSLMLYYSTEQDSTFQRKCYLSFSIFFMAVSLAEFRPFFLQ